MGTILSVSERRSYSPNFKTISFCKQYLFNCIVYVYFCLFWAKNANFRHFSPFYTKIGTSKSLMGPFFIGNHTGKRLKVVPKANFAIFSRKIAKNAKNRNFYHFLGYIWRHSDTLEGEGGPKIFMQAKFSCIYIYTIKVLL